MNQQTKSFHIKNVNTRLKLFTLYVGLVTILVVIWIQFDDFTYLNFNQQENQNNPAYFTSSETDPATWSIQIQENESILSQRSIFPASSFSLGTSLPLVTAVVNRVDDSHEGIMRAVRHLLKYPFIKEIYVYNQIKSKPLTAEQFHRNTTTSVHIEIIEKNAALYSMGKFTACAVAKFEKCYFQDDLWLNPYLDTLYTHSQHYSDHLIVNTRPVNYIDYKKWRFTNKDNSLHTGYADLRYGAFVPRQKVQTFLSQLSTQGLNPNKLNYADIYFCIWFNQYPYLVSNPLLSFGRERFKEIDSVNNRKLIEYYMYDALLLLELSLQNYDSLLIEGDDYFDKSVLNPLEEERDARSSCSNDRCLFITNMNTMPNVDSVQFNSDRVPSISEYETLYNQTNPLIPLKDTYVHQSYHKAVDQNTETCWHSIQKPKAGDYFGLYMAGDIKAKRVIIYTKNHFDEPLDKVFKLTVQPRLYGAWEECKIKLTPTTQLNHRIGFDFECENNKGPLKSIRIHFLRDQTIPFELCSIGIDNFVV
ncbi:hypothetical protein BDF21DRAFT_406362 [Thamnidium elegans]|nr:hypothetical protein BDF21DRAFT_406362 [Thamnidium elegans]